MSQAAARDGRTATASGLAAERSAKAAFVTASLGRCHVRLGWPQRGMFALPSCALHQLPAKATATMLTDIEVCGGPGPLPFAVTPGHAGYELPWYATYNALFLRAAVTVIERRIHTSCGCVPGVSSVHARPRGAPCGASGRDNDSARMSGIPV